MASDDELDDEAGPEGVRAKLLPTEEEKRSRRRQEREDAARGVTMDDVPMIRRIMRYAYVFRAQIAIALFLSMAASTLTAVNILMAIPVLKIILGEAQPEAALVETAEDIERYERKIEEASYFREIDYRLRKFGGELEHDWTQWLIEQEEKAVYYLAVIIVLAAIFKNILEFFAKFINAKSFYQANMRLRIELYKRCLDLNLSDMQRLTSGSLIARLNNDMRQVRQVFTQTMEVVTLEPFKVLALLITMFLMNWRLTLIVMVGLPLIVLPIAIIGKKLRRMGRKDEEEDSKVLGYTQEVLQGLYIVKAFTGERREYKKFRGLSRAIAQRQIRREKMRLYAEPFVEISAMACMAIVMCAGAYLILKSSNAGMSASTFIIYVGIMSRFYPSLKKFSGIYVKLQKGLASAERIFRIIDHESTVAEKPDAIDLPPFEREIVFKDVMFRYLTGHDAALVDFNYRLEKGRRVALVGSTGAGKSTVARLIPRFYDATEGSVLIDGHDVRDVRIQSLREQIAVVSQETILFNDTVFANIRYGRPDATDEEVIESAQAAYAHEFIARLPEGYATVIGERGGRLSGGQRQRLAIARALLADKPILILDEATSALDNESEAIVQRAIEKLMDNRTSLVIAHRLSTVRKADEIVVMHHGRIVERGRHEELLAKDGRYCELLQAHELYTAEDAPEASQEDGPADGEPSGAAT